MAEQDLTSKVGCYLDRHLVFPLMEFLSVKVVYDETEVLQGILELLNNTKMVDLAMDVFKRIHPDEEIPEGLIEKRAEVVKELKQLEEKSEPVTKLFQDEEFLEKAQTSRDGKHLFEYIQKEKGVEYETVENLYHYSKFQYECGNYQSAADNLYFYRVLAHHTEPKTVDALWGKLASEILMQNWDAALTDLDLLKENVDQNHYPELQQLQLRTWLIHWSLFVYFNHPKGRDLLIDLFLYQPKYLNAIQTMCPHILRYLTTAVITTKRRRVVLKDLVKVIEQESYTYKDPITEFLQCLYVDFDFDGAQKKLRECEAVLKNDFFLCGCIDEFQENARLFIFETFCRIHQCISIGMLAEKLDMSPEDAERWIANLIRNARLDAKIDSEKGHVVMGTQASSVYQQVMEKTKGLLFKCQVLEQNYEKKKKSGTSDNYASKGGWSNTYDTSFMKN
ncbi:eukaryotic translation initiation factor 3 subunit E [Paramuricea clavata]|uniref:Eukaryotic translation initiation factor 3 subunit E n=1 Tax=Paramuricea clavata TaxID=317549 RepID=A0A7D9DNC0_PARCT|nr:eukaryotic translation initiation factor 3 subunit E [Paramuricea clavata]